ncbi:zinc abc transporter, inner membrane permease protein znub [hydrocarbon metagenome]|uniref:Zinc abc transporter, inner membrane permease protein znub n=1 Tax=hydrocarbon metagenome TaxID=938273 RepID=A0A0W8E3K6_9ZZZZ
MIEALLNYNFLQNAFYSAILASIACGIIGTIIIEKHLVMMSGGIAHTAFGGIGMGYFLGIEPLIGAMAFAVLSALGIRHLQDRTRITPEVVLGMFWALGMALGILFISFTPGYPPDITSYLFGDILTVSRLDLIITVIMNSIIVITIIMFFNAFKTYLFDEEFAQVVGLPIVLLETMTYVLIALTVVVLIRVVGIMLIIALLTAPPSIARQFTYSLHHTMLLSIALGIIFCLGGLWVSYTMGIPSGAAIIVIAVSSYFLVSLLKTWIPSSHN